MPRYEFFQPNKGATAEYWEVQMSPVLQDGWPGDPTDVPVLDEVFYLDCPVEVVEAQCIEAITKEQDILTSDVLPEDLDSCVVANLDRCGQVLVDALPYEDGWVTMKACNLEAGCSVPSNALVVPEPGLTVALAWGILLLALFAKR